MFYKKGVLKNFTIFTGKHLCQSLFLSCNFIIKETLAQGLSCEFCKTFKNAFFTEHLWKNVSINNSCSLYTLQSYIVGNFQIISREKNHPYI